MAEENKLFHVEIICPDRNFYTGEASMIEMNTVDGEIGVYKEHIPLTTVLAPGIVTITEAEGKKEAAVHAGFVEILQDRVTILAEIAEWPEEININRAEEARKRAEERLNSAKENVDYARAMAALKKALVRIDLRR
ncbi:MAG: ATP synthase F1 subunit epsilon [Lachnospiraceae bacterium]